MELETPKHRRQDIEKQYSQGTKYLTEGDVEKAAQCYEKAYRLARKGNKSKLERCCAFNLGAAYIAWDKPEKGLKYLEKAKPPDEQIDDRSNGDLYFNMGLGYEKMQYKKKALGFFDKALQEYEKHESERVDKRIQCLEKRSDIYKGWNDKSEVKNVNEQIAKLHKNARGRTLTQCNLASFWSDGNREDSVHLAEEYLNMMKSTDKQLNGEECTVAVQVLNELGLQFTYWQRYDKATDCFEKAKKMVKFSHKIHPQLEAVVLQNLGAAYNFSNKFKEAVTCHEEAAAKYGRINYRSGQGQCFINLAFALSQLKDVKESEVAFHHALQASKDTGDKHMRWQALEGIGTANYNQKHFERAARFFEEALEYVEENTKARQRLQSKLEMAEERLSVGQGKRMNARVSINSLDGGTQPAREQGKDCMLPNGSVEEHTQMSATPDVEATEATDLSPGAHPFHLQSSPVTAEVNSGTVHTPVSTRVHTVADIHESPADPQSNVGEQHQSTGVEEGARNRKKKNKKHKRRNKVSPELLAANGSI